MSGSEDASSSGVNEKAEGASRSSGGMAEGVAMSLEEELSEGRRNTLTKENGRDTAEMSDGKDEEVYICLEEMEQNGNTNREDEEVKSKVNADVPASKLQVRITSLSLVRPTPIGSTPSVTHAAEVRPTKTTGSATVNATTSSAADMAARNAAQFPYSVLLTGLTKTRERSFIKEHLPLLIIHRCLEDPHHKLNTKSATGESVDAEGMEAQGLSSSVLQALGSLENDIPNAVSMSMFARENSIVLDIAGIIPMDDMTCSVESGCVPKIRQIVPLDDGNLLAVTCQTADQGTNEPCCHLILYQIQAAANQHVTLRRVGGEVVPSSHLWICAVESSGPHVAEKSSHDSMEDILSADNEPSEFDRRRSILLACLDGSGGILLLDCSSTGLSHVGRGCCDPRSDSQNEEEVGEESSIGEFTQCVFNPATKQLFVASRRGRLLSVKINNLAEEEGGGRRISESGAITDTFDGSDSTIDWSMDDEDLGHLLNLVRTSSRGLPITCSSPVDWSRISLEQVTRKSPLHVNPPPQPPSAGVSLSEPPTPSNGGSSDNSVILQYESPLVANPVSR